MSRAEWSPKSRGRQDVRDSLCKSQPHSTSALPPVLLEASEQRTNGCFRLLSVGKLQELPVHSVLCLVRNSRTCLELGSLDLARAERLHSNKTHLAAQESYPAALKPHSVRGRRLVRYSLETLYTFL